MAYYQISDVTVIVPCRNEKEHVLPFWHSLRELKGYSEFRVIVADGLSSDGTRALLADIEEKDPNLTVVDNPEMIVSTALNYAIGRSQSRLVVRLDMHSVYASDYIQEVVNAFNEVSDNVACVGGSWRPHLRADHFVGEMISVAFQNRVTAGGAKSRNVDYQGISDTVYLGAWRREDLIDVGGFDSTLIRNQDDELCLRFRKKGKEIFQSASIISHYEPRKSLAKLVKQYYQYGYWKVAVLRKHKEFGAIRHWIIFFAPYFLLALGIVDYRLLWGCAVVYATSLVLGAVNVKSASFVARLLSFLPSVLMHGAYMVGLQAAIYKTEKLFGKPTSLSR